MKKQKQTLGKLSIEKFQIAKIDNPKTIVGGTGLNGFNNGGGDDDDDPRTKTGER